MKSRWEAIFDELVEESPGVRSARLAELAASDPELARFVTALLTADRTEAELIAAPLLVRAPAFVASALESGVPRTAARGEIPGRQAEEPERETIGPYRLVRCLGEGGMGEVFLAERSDGEFEQRVALKRIRAGLDSQAIADRFLRERQILARLDHPGIAHLLDGGSTEEGDPYFVLEHVEGVPITEWCEQRAAALETRIGLMIEVADAVDAAHRQLVVHRDLKPTNILVTASGRVKLLDFGIAKLLQAEAFDERQTQIGGQPLTPAYAAPEQILGEAVTTATDVYSMGALLFELVTGRPPFDRAGRPLPALARAVDSETLERPSVVAASAAADVGEPERATVRGFAPRLAGDLDTIVLKALSRDPARRYPSAAALGDDLRRFLAGRPVAAQPDSAGYRMRKFIGRHRFTVAGGAVAALAVVAGIGSVLWQAGIARGEARRADRVKTFLVDLFREADPSQTLGETITAREILEKGASRLEGELVEEPAVRAELLDAIAQVERSLGLLAPAAERADTALALRRKLPARGDLAASLVTRAEIDFDRGELAPARALLDEALRLAPGLGSITLPLGRRWTDARLAILGQQLDVAEAESLARRALAEAQADPKPDGLEVIHWQLGLAGLLADSSRVAEAEPLVRAVLPALAETKGRNPLRLATSRLEAGELLDVLGDKAAAERWLVSGLDLERAALGPDHPEVALWEIKLGYQWSEARRFDDAERILQHAVAVLQPLGHYDAGSALRYLGFVSMGRERFDEAYQRFVEAEKVFRATLGEEGPLQQATRISQGWALLKARRFGEARTLLERVAAESERVDGPANLALRQTLKYLGEVEREMGHPAAALAQHRRALAIERQVFGKDEHLGIAASRYQIALDLVALADPTSLASAGEEIAAAIAVVRKLDPEAPRLEEFLLASARIAARRGDRASARRDLTEAVARYRAHDGATHPRTQAAEQELAQLDGRDRSPTRTSRPGPPPD